MPDADDMRIAVARLEGKLEGVDKGLARQEQNCEARARSHVDRDLYVSERDTIRDDIAEALQATVGLKADLAAERREREQAMKDFEDRRQRDRKWWVATVLIPSIGLILTLLGLMWSAVVA